MAYVSVPKDLTKVKNKVAFNLTKRQLICIGIGAAMGIPCYFLFRNALGINNATVLMVLMYAAVGIHPDEVGSLNEERFQQMKELCKQEKVVAVGEIGLDYYWDNESHDLQKEWFVRQLDLARELKLPVLIHSREAAADTMEIMKQHGQGLKGVIHCFSYSKEMAAEYVKMGFYIGVGGVVTFKNARKLKETVEEIPLTSIVLETDCPYLAPVPYRGKRNNSAYIKYIAEEIAVIKGISYEEVVEQTEKNARDLYNLTEV